MSHSRSNKSGKAVVWLAALTSMALTAGLGVWQLTRAETKREMAQTFEARQALPAWGNGDWPCSGAAEALPAHRPARLRGRWLHDKTVLLDNRPMGGLSGFIVVTPLQLSAPADACSARMVLVQRGWLPRDPQDRLRVPALPPVNVEVEVSGEVLLALSATYALGQEPLPSEAGSLQGGAQATPMIRQNADAAFWQAWLKAPLLPGVLQQTQAARPADAAMLLRHWATPGFGRDRHLAYAAQWFALSGVIAGLTLWFQLKGRFRHVPA
jgi:surfeit locus 1 family protein